MARRRTKSSKELYDQWNRIFDGYNTDYSPNAEARVDRAGRILDRYQDNIRRYFKRESLITNEQFRTPVSRRVYMGMANG